MRTIQSPGIELREIDRSQYDTRETNIVGTASLVMGFSDKGNDYTTRRINTMTEFVNIYGYPEPNNEAEKYFYNSATEILNRGGILYTSKLPYDNEALGKFSYTTYSVNSQQPIPLSSTYDILKNEKSSDISLYDFLLMPNISVEQSNIYNFNIIEFYNNNEINLSIITDMFNYIKERYNFRYSSKSAFDFLFYQENSEYAFNNSVYRLTELLSDLQSFKTSYLSTEELSNEYSDQVDDIYDTLTTNRNIEGLIEDFGKSNTIKYYRDYFNNLSCVTKSVISNTEQRDIILRIMDNFLTSNVFMSKKYTGIKNLDETLTSYLEINSNDWKNPDSGMIDITDLDKLIVGDSTVKRDTIQIVDITRQKYIKDPEFTDKEYIGIVPVITTPANALFFQNMISYNKDEYLDYNVISTLQNTFNSGAYTDFDYQTRNFSAMISGLNGNTSNTEITGFTQNFGSEDISDRFDQETLSRTTASLFPEFKFKNGKLDHDNIKKIGIVVLKMYIDEGNENKIGFLPVESFIGSLNKYETDINTRATVFIDNIVNTNSNYIRCFSNVEFAQDNTAKLTKNDRASTFIISNQNITSLGLYEKDCLKKISVKTSINKAIDKIFDNNKDLNTIDIDLVVDSGVSNIAQYIKSVYGDNFGRYRIDTPEAFNFKLNTREDVNEWYTVINKYDNFCKNTRKDCMFIADGLRPLCVKGNSKVIRDTNHKNTIQNTILKNIKQMSGLINTSYGAGYCDWFYTIDASVNSTANNYFWCPPSIKNAGIYLYTDTYSNYWMAPAGLNRGRVSNDVVDIAFNPDQNESDYIYNNNWNYSVSYPLNGIVVEGQRTFQKNKTAFDRVNVRRLFLGLEKRVRYIAKFFKYEGITDYLMMRFRDSLTPIFEDVKNKGGIRDYYIICDQRNNNANTIDNNELHCTIAVRPDKSLEFILLSFICTNQSANVQEVAESEL